MTSPQVTTQRIWALDASTSALGAAYVQFDYDDVDEAWWNTLLHKKTYMANRIPPDHKINDKSLAWAEKVHYMVAQFIADFIGRESVHVVAIEAPFAGPNKIVYAKLFYLKTRLQLVAARNNVPVIMVQPAQAEKAFLGSAKSQATTQEGGTKSKTKQREAKKGRMMARARELYGPDIQEDEADAIAVAWAAHEIINRKK